MNLEEGSFEVDKEIIKGKWGYIPELNGIDLLDGVTIQNDGVRYGGKRKYYPQMKGMDLEDGWFERDASGDYREEGKWGWSLEMNESVVKCILCISFHFRCKNPHIFPAFGWNEKSQVERVYYGRDICF